MSFSFIHAADIHLDSPLRGLERYEGAPVEEIRNATREAFNNLIDLAIEKKAAFVIIAGDLYDGDWKDYNTGLFFIKQMVRLQKENIKVFLLRGNHDAASVITKELKLPDNCFEFSVNKPETYCLEELSVAIHGQGFPYKAVKENIVKQYPDKKEGYLNIGVLHTSATGREGHETYAPCSVDDLKEKGYDYWALGHVHQREMLHEKDPVILFPGNIQGRHIRERGEKGCSIVEVENGAIQSVSHHPLDVLRWELCEINIDGMETIDEVMDGVRDALGEMYKKSDGRLLAARLRLHGKTKLHQELVTHKEHYMNNFRSAAIEMGAGDIWIEKVIMDTSYGSVDEQAINDHAPVSFIMDYIDQMMEDDEEMEELLGHFQDIKQALPYHVVQEEEGFDFSDPSFIKNRIEDVKALILYHLTEKGAGNE